MKNAIYIFLILLLVSIFVNASTASEYLETDQDNAILLKNAVFDTSKQSVVPANAEFATSQYSTDTEEYYILQFRGNVLEEWKQTVKNTGAVFFDYVPNNAFIVRMNSSVKSQIEAMDIVQWVGTYQPAYKISPVFSASSIAVTTTTTTLISDDDISDIIVMLFDSKHNTQVTSEIETLGGEIVDNGGEIMRIRIGTSKLSDIAAMNGVSWIEKYVQPVIFNDVAADIINVSYVQNTHGLTGSGQIVAVADTGLDTGVDDSTMHDDIEGRIVSLHAWWDGNADDQDGHGTHVAGSVLGSGSHSTGQYAGMAPMSQIVFQALQYDGSDPSYDGKLLTPVNLALLFQEAYDDDAKIHSNSWGFNNATLYGNYTSSSKHVDSFMWNNTDMLIVFAAGNYGPSQNTVSPPGTAKNALTVGASQSSRMGGDIDDIASFSSRGATDDGRIKPDIVAPGTWIVSTASSVATYASPVATYYAYMSGTSMATPITAGAAALVRQYYVENESISPSAALIKATLINGAVNMSLSTNDQGWGRVDIEKSLFPTSSQTIRYHDNINLDTSQSWNVSYHVNNSLEPLEITLVWTDYPGNPAAIPQLVNNLDLNVTGPDGSYLGNGGDNINNVERVKIISPTIGSYTITINGTNIPYGPQPFALVISWGIDEYPPSASDEFPVNNSYMNNNTTAISINITDTESGVNLSSIEMSINDNPIEFTNVSIPNGYKIENVTSTPYNDGLVNVSVTASDNASNSLTYNWSFIIDTTMPVITNATATPSEIEANGTDNTLLNVTATDLYGISSVYVNLSAIGGLSAQPMSNNSGVWQFTTNTTTVGTFELPVNITDNAGNSNTSVNISLNTIDTTPPVIISATGNPSEIEANGTDNTLLNVTTTDLHGIASVYVNLSTIGGLSAQPMSNNSGVWQFTTNTTTVSTFELPVNVTDNTGNSNTSVNITLNAVDTITPVIISANANPTEIEANGTDNTLLNVTANDFHGITSVYVNLSAIGGLSAQPMSNNSGVWQFTTNTTTVGTFELPVNVTDNAGNSNTSVNISLNATDTTPPIIISANANPTEIEANGTDNTLLNVTATDLHDITSVSVNLSSIGGSSAQPMSNNSGVWQFTTNTTTVGTFELPLNVTDNTGNSNTGNSNTSINISLNATDTTPPTITDATANPPAIVANGTDNTLLNLTTTDLHGITSVSINLSAIEGSPTQAMVNNSGVWQFTTNTTVSGKNGTLINLPLNVTDGEGNSNTSYNIALGLKLKEVISAGNLTLFNVTVNETKLNVTVLVPADTNLSSGILTAAPVAAPGIPDGFEYGGVAVDLNGLIFNKSLTITLEYPAATQNQTKLKLWFYNTTTDRWEMIEGSTVNTTTHTVSGNVNHFTVFAPLADITLPTISIISPTNGYSTTASTITVSGTVNGTGSLPVVTVNDINASTTLIDFNGTFTVTSVPISLGTSTIYANVTDASGNINSTSISVTRTSPESPSSGGGSGGGGSTGEEYENIEFKDVSRVYVSTGADVTFTFDKAGNDIQSINYKALSSAGYISATIEVLKDTSTLVEQAPSGEVYKNMNIWVGKYGYATESNIENPVVGFKVQRSWMQDNHIDESSIKLNRYSDDVWTALPTTKTDEDATYLYFESQTPGFSPFAIAAQEKTISSQVSIKDEPVADSLSPIEETSVETTTTPEIKPVEKTSIWGNLLIGALILIIIAGAYMYKKKQQD